MISRESFAAIFFIVFAVCFWLNIESVSGNEVRKGSGSKNLKDHGCLAGDLSYTEKKAFLELVNGYSKSFAGSALFKAASIDPNAPIKVKQRYFLDYDVYIDKEFYLDSAKLSKTNKQKAASILRDIIDQNLKEYKLYLNLIGSSAKSGSLNKEIRSCRRKLEQFAGPNSIRLMDLTLCGKAKEVDEKKESGVD